MNAFIGHYKYSTTFQESVVTKFGLIHAGKDTKEHAINSYTLMIIIMVVFVAFTD